MADMSDVERHRQYIERAIDIAVANVASGRGGPFGALIVRGDIVVAESGNSVIAHNDPTAHAEIETIRIACSALNVLELFDCVMYASCEPCPMCLGAIYWSRLARVYYSATRDDAVEFDDAHIYREMTIAPLERTIPMQKVVHARSSAPFDAWIAKPDRRSY